MKYYGIDIETDDPCLNTVGQQKSRGVSWIYGEGEILCVSIYSLNGVSNYSDDTYKNVVKEMFLDSDVCLIGANIGYDVGWIINELGMNALEVKCQLADILIAEIFISDVRRGISLDVLSKKYLNKEKGIQGLVDIATKLELKGDVRRHLKKIRESGYIDEIVSYCQQDTFDAYNIFIKQEKILRGQNQFEVFINLNRHILYALSLTQRGCCIDKDKFDENRLKIGVKYNELCTEFHNKYFISEPGDVNINSTQKVAKLLDKYDICYYFKITLKEGHGYVSINEALKILRDLGVYPKKCLGKYSFSVYSDKKERFERVLNEKNVCFISNPTIDKEFFEEKKDEHDCLNQLNRIKVLDKLLSGFFSENYKRFFVPSGDGFKIHCNFKAFGAANSGRYSCVDPNLQNISSKRIVDKGGDNESFGAMCRECFIPDKDHVIVCMDYTGQETRLQAHFALGKDGEFIQDKYNNDPFFDEHELVGEMTGLIDKYGYDLGRSRAKNCRFGISYGLGAYSMAKQYKWSIEEAKSILNEIKKKAPWMSKTMEAIQNLLLHKPPHNKAPRNYIQTIGGRRIYHNPNITDDVYKFYNLLIQGSGADMFMKAFEKIVSIKTETGWPILLIHDEIVFSVANNEYGIEYVDIVHHLMETTTKLKVPVKCGVSIGKDWNSCVKYDPKKEGLIDFTKRVFNEIKRSCYV